VSESKARKARLTLAAIGVLTVGVLVGGGLTAMVVLGDDDSGKGGDDQPSPTATASPTGDSSASAFTPDKAPKLVLEAPTGQKDGLSTGFSDGPVGAKSTAVHFWEEYAFLDDQKARQQLESVVSPDAEGYVDQQISEIRTLREELGLPPSGGTPAGLTFTTSVNAIRTTSLDQTGRIVQIWLNYDRYAVQADGSPDDDPLKGQQTDLILKLQDGRWQLTNEPEYWKKRSFPVDYAPDSHDAWRDGWQQVRHGG